MSVIWDVDTIREVQKLYVDTFIADEMIVAESFDEDVVLDKYREEYRRYVLDQINVYVRHGITSHVRPDEFTSRRLGVNLRLYWQPLTKDAEFINGPIRGTCHTLQKIELAGHYKVPLPQRHFTLAEDSGELNLDTVTYRFYGWNDSTGRWLYIGDPQGRRNQAKDHYCHGCWNHSVVGVFV